MADNARDNAELNDLSDEVYELRRQLSAAEGRASAMRLARDPAKMDDLALAFSIRIENIFARGWEGGVGQRRTALQVEARKLIESVISGG